MPEPTVLYPLTLPDLLMKLLDSPSKPTILIVCLSRATFIRLLLTQLPVNHPLLVASLNLLDASSQMQLIFCDTVQVLQAYLAVMDNVIGAMYLIHPLRQHMHTPAFSAQGLSRTFSSLSDAIARTSGTVFIVEPIEGLEGEEDPWDQHVPILGSGGKFSGQRGWVGRTVGVKRIIGRWCRFINVADDKMEIR
jgi:hypothetical protein